MELASAGLTIERSEQFVEKTFSIGDPLVIMKILRSKLYSNPIKILIQEYLCNARDANREAGNFEGNIEVQCPTVFSRSFEVRDYGIGISPDRMENVFIRYGESTKRGNNIQTGGFGIGAKSGWAYSDSFSITTVTQEGDIRVKRFYSAIIDETEKGSLIKIADDMIVDEPTGTRITVPVKDKDYRLFESYIKQTVFFWKENVIVAGFSDTKFKFDDTDVAYSGENWKLLKKENGAGMKIHGEYARRSNCLAIIDGIQYDIKHDVGNNLDPKLEIYDIFNNMFLIYFKTGELNVSANREELYYDDKTKNKIAERLVEIKNEFINKVSDKFNSIDTYLNLVSEWKSFSKEIFNFKDNKNNFLTKIKWKNNDVKITPEITHGPFPGLVRKYGTFDSGRRKSGQETRIDIDKNIIIYENDEGERLPDRLKIQTLIDLHGETPFYTISYGEDLSGSVSRSSFTDIQYEKLKQQWRKDNSIDMFDLPKMSSIEKKKLAYGRGGSTGARTRSSCVKEVAFPVSSNWIQVNPVSVVISEINGYYIPIVDRNKIEIEKKFFMLDNRNTRAVLNPFSKYNIYLIPQKTLNRAIASKNGFKLKCFNQLIIDSLNSNPEEIQKFLLIKKIHSNVTISALSNILKNLKLNNDKNIEKIMDADLVKYISNTISTTNNEKLHQFFNEFEDRLSADRETTDIVKDLVEESKRILKKYPLLEVVRESYSTKVPAENVIEYINCLHAHKDSACVLAKV